MEFLILWYAFQSSSDLVLLAMLHKCLCLFISFFISAFIHGSLELVHIRSFEWSAETNWWHPPRLCKGLRYYSVPHQRLLIHTLKHFGIIILSISGSIATWLTKRSQRVALDGWFCICSFWSTSKYLVPWCFFFTYMINRKRQKFHGEKTFVVFADF